MSPLHLDMGRYAAFVWPAWAISALVLGALVADTLWRARRWRAARERLDNTGKGDQP